MYIILVPFTFKFDKLTVLSDMLQLKELLGSQQNGQKEERFYRIEDKLVVMIKKKTL